jgi:predicted ester cyclase
MTRGEIERLVAIKDIVRRFFEDVAAGDLDLVYELVSEDCLVHAPGREIRGVELVKDIRAGQIQALGDWTITVEQQIAEGDLVASLLTMSGIHSKEFLGVPPSGKRVTFTSTFLDRVVDGKIVEGWHQGPDYRDLIRQVGSP